MKRKPYPKYKPSGVAWLGDIPSHWDMRKFSREVAIAEGQADPESKPYISMLLIGPGHVESGTGRLLQRATAADQAAESGKYFCRKGDVIYSKIRPALNRGTLNELRMLVPPLPEQVAIAAYLDAETAKLDTLVAKIAEAVERLQEYRAAPITAAVTGKIDVRECYQYGNSCC